VTGIGAVGGFGCGVDAFARALSSPSPVLPGSISFPSAGTTVEMPLFRADTASLADHVAPRSLRRVDHYSRLALLGCSLALRDGALPEGERERIGLVVATGYGATGITFAFLDSFIRDGDLCASPTHFANSVHNSAAANVSILLGITGPVLTVSRFDLSFPDALATARLWLLEGTVDRVLAGAVDEFSDLLGYLWHRTRGVPAPGGMRPFRTREETAVPGEGALFLLLSRVEGDGPGYCTLEDVVTGRGPLPRFDGVTILGADGRADTGPGYAGASAGSVVAAFRPRYGSFPAAAAFDAAAAALSLSEGRLPATPFAGEADFPASVAAAGDPAGDALRCLTLDGRGGFGAALLRAAGR
jgi:3-oxoacyl-[acyl-carrier-protein] synthase II